MDDVEESWVLNEFASVDFGDFRLKKRFTSLAEQLSNSPEASINQACEDWNSVKSAYRFFQNDRVNEAQILQPHIMKTVERCQQHKYILSIQDTTVISYASHPKTKGIGRIGGGKGIAKPKGINMHSALALSPTGIPLGLLSNLFWTRTTEKQHLNQDQQPTDEKESYKWIQTIESCHENLGTNFITICDREADIHDLYLSAKDLNIHTIVRSSHNRDIGTRKQRLSLHEALSKKQVYKGKLVINVPIKNVKGHKESQRDAILELKSITIKLTPSRKISQVVKEKVELTAVEAKEANPPEGLEPVHWILLTTIPVKTFKQSQLIVYFYSLRWRIESFFKLLKSGCTVEKCRLAKGDRLKNYISLFCVIAWRIFWMTFIGRASPKLNCKYILTENEWKTLFSVINKTSKTPKEPPLVETAIKWMAQLGGYLARENDGPPGMMSIWRGWSRLQDMCLMREIALSSE